MRSLKAGVCAMAYIESQIFYEQNMLSIRLYISALTLFFLVLVISYRGLGVLEAIVVTCAVLYLILDVRTELKELKSELSMLQDLEQHVSKLLSLNS